MTKFKFTGAMAALATVLFSFILLSCNNEEEFLDEVVFDVSESSLVFTAAGESKTVDVTLENGRGDWRVTTEEEIEWLTFDYDGSAPGTLTVTASENPLYESRTASFTLRTEGHNGLTVAVTQEGLFANGEPEHAADRTSWWRMGIKGHVKKLSGYYDYMAADLYLQNLEFDRYGMLVKFSYIDPYTFITDEVHIEYDSEQHSRITKIYCPSSDNHYPWQILFHYGNHGKYITPYDTFTTLDNQQLFTYWRMWMPNLIKDLATIEIVEHSSQAYDGLKFVYSFSGNSGTSKMTLPYEGGLYEEDFHSMVYDGAYPKTVDYPFALMGFPMPMTSDYDIDPANGYYRKFDWSYFMSGLGSETWVSRVYNNDANNSITSMFDFFFGFMDLQPCVYNEQADLIQVGTYMSASYIYDSRNNWTKAMVTVDTMPAEYLCEIEYFD